MIAHPHTLYLSWNRLFEVLTDYKNKNLDGIEVWHPGASYKDALRLEAIAKELNLGVSAGSDFHGEIRPDRKIGRSLTERRKIEDRFLAIIDQ